MNTANSSTGVISSAVNLRKIIFSDVNHVAVANQLELARVNSSLSILSSRLSQALDAAAMVMIMYMLCQAIIMFAIIISD